MTIKTEDALKAYNVLATAKYGKLEDADKIKVWKIARVLKPVAEQFDGDSKDAAEKMKPSDDFDERLGKAQEYERMLKQPDVDMSTLPMGAAEYSKFVEDFRAYNKLVNEAVREFAEKEVELELDLLTEDSLGKLMASNDWTMAQVMNLSFLV